MQAIPLIPLVGAALWLVACLSIAALVWLRNRGKGFSREHAFFAAGMAALAWAPCASLIGYVIGNTLFAGGVGLVVAFVLFAASLAARRERDQATVALSWMTFREKSAVLVLASLCLVSASYFARTWNATFEVAIAALIGSIILFIVIQVIGHILLGLSHTPHDEIEEAPDERYRKVELYSIRNSHWALACVFWVILVLAFVAQPLTVAQTALAVMVLSEVVYYGSILAYYRFGSA